VVEAGHDDVGVVEPGLDPEAGDAPVAGAEPFVDLPVGHVGVGAPQFPEDLGVEVGVAGEGAGLGARHGGLGVGRRGVRAATAPPETGAATAPPVLPTMTTWVASG